MIASSSILVLSSGKQQAPTWPSGRNYFESRIKRGHKNQTCNYVHHSWEHQLCICAASTELIETSMNEESIIAKNGANEISA